MSTVEVKVPNIGDFKDVEIIELMVKPGDTIAADHDLNTYLGLLRTEGAMVIVGVPPAPSPVAAMSVIYGNKKLAGSMIGGIAQTQEMLDYCAEKKIVSSPVTELTTNAQLPASRTGGTSGKMRARGSKWRTRRKLAPIAAQPAPTDSARATATGSAAFEIANGTASSTVQRKFV